MTRKVVIASASEAISSFPLRRLYLETASGLRAPRSDDRTATATSWPRSDNLKGHCERQRSNLVVKRPLETASGLRAPRSDTPFVCHCEERKRRSNLLKALQGIPHFVRNDRKGCHCERQRSNLVVPSSQALLRDCFGPSSPSQ